MAKTEMRPIKDTIPLEEARALIEQASRADRSPRAGRPGRCQRPRQRRRRASTRDVPPFSRAGMDGYAVIADDTFGASRYEPKTLRVIEKVYTGQVPDRCASSPAPPSRSPPARRCPPAPTRW